MKRYRAIVDDAELLQQPFLAIQLLYRCCCCCSDWNRVSLTTNWTHSWTNNQLFLVIILKPSKFVRQLYVIYVYTLHGKMRISRVDCLQIRKHNNCFMHVDE